MVDANPLPDTQSNADVTQPVSNSALDILTDAKQTKEELVKVRDEIKELLKKQEELAVKHMFGGTAMAGQSPPKEKTVEDIAQEKANETIRSYFKR